MTQPTKPYKNKSNAWYTKALVWEMWINEQMKERLEFDPIFSLYQDKPGMINIRTTFVELGDPSGYKWAMKYLGDYEHWKAFMKCKWFQEAYDVWMEEMKAKDRSEALDVIRTIAKDGQPAQSLLAAKYLASFEWDKQSRGRPSKAELQGELKRAARVLEVEDEDADRIGLKLKVVK